MAVPFSNTKLRVPKGFQNILEGLAREILRNQPENPFEFGSKYFDQLLKVREETGHDPAVHGARLEDRFYNNDSFKNPSVDPGSPQQQEAALKIQTNYRKHAAEQEVAEMKEEDAAEKIQAGFRGYQDRQKYQDMKSPEKKEEAEEEKVDIDLNDPDVEAAAVKIQAGFKGFKARQEIKEVKDQKGKSSSPEPAPAQRPEEEVDIDLTDPEVNDAAQKIQAGFRGHKARKEVADMKANRPAKSDTAETAAPEAGEKPTESVPRQSPEAPAGDDEVDLDIDNPELAEAALKIQTGFRGHLARKEVEALKEKQPSGSGSAHCMAPVEAPKEEEVDIDLNDPEVAVAALKIQSGFRSHMLRKDKKEKQASDLQSEQKATDTKEAPADKVDAPNENADEETGTKAETSDGKDEATQKVDEPTGNVDAAPQKADEAGDNVDVSTEKVEEVTKKPDEAKNDKVDEATEKVDEATEKPDEAKNDKVDEGTEKVDEATEKAPMDEASEKAEAGETPEADIDLNDPELAGAALKIQSGFRGYQARKEVQASKEAEQKTEEKAEEKSEEKEDVDIDLNDPDVENAALKIQAGFKGMKARQEVKALKESNTEGETEKTEEAKEEVDIDLNDPETEKAALKIQAGFKGYQTRKELKSQKEGDAAPEAQAEAEPQKTEGEEEKVDIDLNDPETEKAALKIQAGFKGYQTRKELKEKKVESGIGTEETPREDQAPTEEKTEEETKTEGEKVDIDLDDPEVAKAATKIQAGFKGYKTRQEFQQKKDAKDNADNDGGN